MQRWPPWKPLPESMQKEKEEDAGSLEPRAEVRNVPEPRPCGQVAGHQGKYHCDLSA